MRRVLVAGAAGVWLVWFTWVVAVPPATAVPAFARKYGTSCATCHYAFPKLNAFGKAFMNNGFRYPAGQDPDMTKEEPVSLGAEGNKKSWPDALWPSDIAGTSPLSIHLVGRLHYAKQFDDPSTRAVEKDKGAFFETPHELEVLFAGTIGENVSYFGEVELEHAAELAYEFFAQYDFHPAVHLRLGSVALQASPQHMRLTRENYNLEDLRNQSGTWRLRDGSGGGVELWGAGNGPGGSGGFTYAAGLANGQTDVDKGENFDLNRAKDVFLRATYKIRGLGETGGAGTEGSETSAFYIDDSFRIGGFLYAGKAATAVADTVAGGFFEDDFTVVGGDIDWWFKRLLVTAVAMQMTSDFAGYERTSLAWMAEANYVFYPWLIAHTRYEYTDRDTDKDAPDPATNLIPALIGMVRPNVKCSLEYLMPLDDARKNDDRFTFQFNIAF